MFDEDLPQRKIVHEIGQELDRLSVAELGDRIALLQREIARLEAARAAKGSHLSAADALFRR